MTISPIIIKITWIRYSGWSPYKITHYIQISHYMPLYSIIIYGPPHDHLYSDPGLDKVVIACDERIAAKAAGLDQRPLTRRRWDFWERWDDGKGKWVNHKGKHGKKNHGKIQTNMAKQRKYGKTYGKTWGKCGNIWTNMGKYGDMHINQWLGFTLYPWVILRIGWIGNYGTIGTTGNCDLTKWSLFFSMESPIFHRKIPWFPVQIFPYINQSSEPRDRVCKIAYSCLISGWILWFMVDFSRTSYWGETSQQA